MRAPTILRKKVTAHYAAVSVGARILCNIRFLLNDWKKKVVIRAFANKPYRPVERHIHKWDGYNGR